MIYDHIEQDIAKEIIKENGWMGDECMESVIKFPNSNTIKITFIQTTTAKKCTEHGILAFNLSIPTRDIHIETYIPIITCMCFYALEKQYQGM